MSWLRSTAGVNKIHKLNCCHIYTMILILYLFTAGISFLVYRTPNNWFLILGFVILGIAGFLILTILLGLISQIFTGLVLKLCILVDKKKNKK